MHRAALRIGAAFVTLAPSMASAHPGRDGAGVVDGFLHPLGGVDHIVAMVAVGLLAARIGGRALWLPASFVATMATAGLAGMGLVAFFAVFRGYAHGAEMPETASGLAYGAGFVAATALLHGIGIALGLAIAGNALARRAAAD